MEKVFVYGSLKQGYGNHTLLETSELVSEGKTVDDDYTMLSLGGFPGVLLQGTTRILGEVYEVTDEVFQRLDRLEGFPSFYNRKEIEVEQEHGDVVSAWMYFLNEDEDTYHQDLYTLVEDGNW